MPDAVTAALQRVVAELPGGGEARPGQVEMAAAVTAAISGKRHLAVQAGTGTGKTLAYLVPMILSRKKVVVATATKALQDQLAGKDLPFLQAHLPEHFEWAVLKGRSNYLCLQRLSELAARDDHGEQLGLDGVAQRAPADELLALARWSATTQTGDRAELDVEPSDRAWAAVSVSARECPGASRCPSGGVCFAEGARLRANEADVVVVNLHLYGLDLAAGGMILPEHDVVVVDEAHQLEEIVSATSGVDLTGGRFTDLARRTRGVIADDQIAAGVDDAGRMLTEALRPHRDHRLRALPDDLGGVLAVARGRVERVLAAARAVPSDAPEESRSRALRVQQSASALLEDLEAVELVTASQVMWVEGSEANPVLRVAPIDVSGLLREALWSKRPAVLTSATLPAHLPDRLGLLHDEVTELDVGSPFDYQAHALLYCAAHLPDPRSAAYLEAMVTELGELIAAAGGRTLGLFTSFRVLDEAAAALQARLDVEILTQRSLPKAKLLERFMVEEETCLFATMGFWQGVDVPGRSLSLVAIDRIPFGRPDEPLLQARRESAGAAAFRLIDLPRATTLLAQGAGRLIRSASDTGVVAVLDPRLATAGYRWDVVNALPPMRRTKDPAEARRTLEAIRQGA
ncbi:MAG TPA: ATP-dependent DNA helicase [Acidimicrobiales bacterium]|nr:ATP-dependent DNA helicase [Acidimicrobiales bacterium]